MSGLNSDPIEAGFTLVVTLLFFALGLYLAIWPRMTVSLLARWFRAYQHIFRLSDSQLDSTGLSFQRSLLGGSISRFVQTGVRTPEDYPAAIALVRTFGILIASIIGLVLCLMLSLMALSLLVAGRA